MSQSIPIIIMTRNENGLLKTCIDSILHTISCPFHIYVIDNNSNEPEQISILDGYSNHEKITVLKNKNNLWVLGLNYHLNKIKKLSNSEYFVMTDGDIEFKNNNDKTCWLSDLISYMEQFRCLGKIGISLNWDLIAEDPFYREIYEQECKLYDEHKKIGPLYISPVDTTAAIYRWDWSITGFNFYPDHIRYLRPELYSCRTPRSFTADHHGWINYKLEPELSKLEEKIKCFTLMGADIKITQLKRVSSKTRFFNQLLAKPMKIFWGMRRRYYLLKYILRKGMRKLDNH